MAASLGTYRTCHRQLLSDAMATKKGAFPMESTFALLSVFIDVIKIAQS
jgi:hypothetical protein